jgi:Fe-S-cluster containining protein
MNRRLAELLNFVDFGEICKFCNINCCRRFYAVLLPEEEGLYEHSFEIETPIGKVKAIGSNQGKSCPYLDEKGLCRIYSIRPFDCRLWPVMMYYDFDRDEKVVYLDLDCPAVKGNRIPEILIKKIIEVLKNIDIDKEWLKKYTLAPWPNNLREIMRFK